MITPTPLDAVLILRSILKDYEDQTVGAATYQMDTGILVGLGLALEHCVCILTGVKYGNPVEVLAVARKLVEECNIRVMITHLRE